MGREELRGEMARRLGRREGGIRVVIHKILLSFSLLPIFVLHVSLLSFLLFFKLELGHG